MSALSRIRGFRIRRIENFRAVLLKAWSVRLIVLATLLEGAQAGCGFFTGSDLVSPGTLTVLNCGLMLAALAARLVAQEAVSGSTVKGDA
ncbi:hypothetical protein ASF33_19085 [Methylobacterium sp. Leaf92]|nr:hypothetical protein ASF33_19085 [Methylobacterium sp. Leaf92]